MGRKPVYMTGFRPINVGGYFVAGGWEPPLEPPA
jgi:hypothetical protein